MARIMPDWQTHYLWISLFTLWAMKAAAQSNKSHWNEVDFWMEAVVVTAVHFTERAT